MIKLKSLSKRGAQDPYALPLIITTFLALFIAYLMWVQPQERLCFLGFCEDIETTSVYENKLQSFEIGYVGGLEKETLETISLDSVEISDFPNSDTLIAESDFDLNSNFFLSGAKKFKINDFDLNSDFMRINFKLESFAGNPGIKLIINNNPFYLGTDYENNIQIPSSNLSADNEIKIVCQYHGLEFWKKQSCSIKDFKVLSDYYDGRKKIEEREFTLNNPNNIGFVELNFYVENSTNGKNLNVSINDFPIFIGTPTKGRSVQITEEAGSLVNLIKLRNNNKISFIAEKDSRFLLKNILLNFKAKEISAQSKTISFEVKEGQAEKDAQIIANITEVVLPGIIDFTLYPSHITIEKNIEGEGILIVGIDSKYIEEGINNLKIDSPNGRFKIKDIKIVLG